MYSWDENTKLPAMLSRCTVKNVSPELQKKRAKVSQSTASIQVSFERLLDVNSNTQHRYSLAISVKWNLEMVDIAHTK